MSAGPPSRLPDESEHDFLDRWAEHVNSHPGQRFFLESEGDDDEDEPRWWAWSEIRQWPNTIYWISPLGSLACWRAHRRAIRIAAEEEALYPDGSPPPDGWDEEEDGLWIS